MSVIKPRERDALIQSLRAGVVPRVGQHLIQVGRLRELDALIQDIDRIAAGGSAFRIVTGNYGDGKTFFLNLGRAIALEKKLVATNADLTPDRRLHATGGQARSLYAELMKNLATRTKPEGGALPAVVEKFIAQAQQEAAQGAHSVESVIQGKLAALSELVGGFDFAAVIAAYWKGHETDNDVLKNDAIRWLRGEFSTKSEARAALGVRTIIDDASFYDHLKLMARFLRLAGYAGLLVCLDELVNLFKMANTQARRANYEQILRLLNDSLQGSAEGLGLVLGGTPEFLTDRIRGLYSYEALQSRLAENTFARDGLVDYSHPVLKLSSLSPEDFYVLLTKIRHVFASGDPARYLLPDEALPLFMEHCARRIGASYFKTPRNTITAFVNLLAVLEQNPSIPWQQLLEGVAVAVDGGAAADTTLEPDLEAKPVTLAPMEDDAFANLQL